MKISSILVLLALTVLIFAQTACSEGLPEEEKEIWSKFGAINAVKKGRIHIIDSYEICSPTTLSFVETLESIFQLLHPEIE